MRSFTSSIGLTALAVAVALGVMKNKDEPGLESSQSPEKAKARKVVFHSRSINPRIPGTKRPEPNKVESLAFDRLNELTETLSLSQHQIDELRPLILRVTPGYVEENSYPSYHPTASANSPVGPPLLRPEFEDRLFSLLDGDQQLDYAASVAEREVWWSDIIARLEADLDRQTSPEVDLPAPAPSEPTSRGGRNLFQSE